jgi:hypothetical protein
MTLFLKHKHLKRNENNLSAFLSAFVRKQSLESTTNADNFS